MKWALDPVTTPDIEVVTVERMKRELGEFADIDDRDTDIEGKIKAAREWLTAYTACVPVDQTWQMSIDQTGDMALRTEGTTNSSGTLVWAGRVGDFYLRRTPVLDVVSMVTVDAAGAETTVPEAEYALREPKSKYPRIVPLSGATWTGSNLKVTFRAGHADRTGSPQQDASVVPERLKEAIILYAKWLYDGDADCHEAALKMARPFRAQLGLA